tara:strand:+ start:395 stop:1363 length:969 start_codon:yes stop_codon:yes gene_type:complete
MHTADQDYAIAQYAVKSIDWENPKNSENYVIRGVRRENVPGYISTKSGWEYKLKSVEARIEFKGQGGAKFENVSAYFYNREGNLIEKFNSPPRRQDDEGRYIEADNSFSGGDVVEAYFPLTEFLEESDWATVVVAFGSGNSYSVTAMPKTSFEHLDFPQKKIVFPTWKPDNSKSTASEKSDDFNVELELCRLTEGKYKDSLSFNGDYQIGKPCVSAEVRSIGEAPPGEGNVALYVFDAGGISLSREKILLRLNWEIAVSMCASPALQIAVGTPFSLPWIETSRIKNIPPMCLSFNSEAKLLPKLRVQSARPWSLWISPGRAV